MRTVDWLTLAAIIIGPVIAVAITLWIEDRRKNRDAKLTTLRALLASRDFPSDPSYQVAIKLVPIEFNDCTAVLTAHREFLEAANVDTDGLSEDRIKAVSDKTSVKLTRLLFEMARASGLNIRETDIQTGGFGSRGFLFRDALLQDSQKAMRDVANILWMQTRMLGGATFEQVTSHLARTDGAETAAKPDGIEVKD